MMLADSISNCKEKPESLAQLNRVLYYDCMGIYLLISIIVSFITMIFLINQHYFRLPPTVALMASSLLASILLLLVKDTTIGSMVTMHAQSLVREINFKALLLHGLLGPLLFSGSFLLDLSLLRRYLSEILVLAFFSTLLSAILITVILHVGVGWFGYHLPWLWCAIFGALISPTDPVAVLATFKALKMPASLTVRVAGESLFNDGIGIVLFTVILQMLVAHTGISVVDIGWLFVRESLGGLLFGLLLGYVASKLLRDNSDVISCVFIGLTVATAGFTCANMLQMSGALAMVSAGMAMRYGLKDSVFFATNMAQTSMIWGLIEDILNAILFLLIGFELLELSFHHTWILMMFSMIVVLLLVRAISVFPVLWIFSSKTPKILLKKSILFTWSGLRGGLAIALALSLPNGIQRDLLIMLTFGVVAFSVIFQGVTLKTFLRLYHKS